MPDGGSAISTVGFVAVGRMGLPMANHAAAKGFDVVAFDPGVADGDFTMTASPRDLAAKADIAIVSVPTDDDVQAAITGDDGLLAGAGAGFLIAVSSSVHPDTMHALEGPCREAGVGLIDAPVTGGIRGAVAGELTVLAGGDEADIERARPVFDSYAAHVHRMGGVGTGQIGKMVNNMMLWANYMAAGQALQYAEAAGLDAEHVRGVMNDCTGKSWALEQFPDVRPIWPGKDMAAIAVMLKDMGLSLPLIEHVAANAKSISIEN